MLFNVNLVNLHAIGLLIHGRFSFLHKYVRPNLALLNLVALRQFVLIFA